MRLLDLFCGAGGAAVGYHQAGFTEIVGVDINPQPNYPFEFVHAEVFELLHSGRFDASTFDLIHASPPCQAYSSAMQHLSHPQPKLISQTKTTLTMIGRPYVVENVPGAPLVTSSDLFGAHGVLLCGSMFNLRIKRHRLFETSFPITGLECRCSAREVWNPHNAGSRLKFYEKYGRQDPEKPWREEMGVTWMGRYEAREAIPPAYTKFIGATFISQLARSS